jgi:hypothetical protein
MVALDKVTAALQCIFDSIEKFVYSVSDTSAFSGLFWAFHKMKLLRKHEWQGPDTVENNVVKPRTRRALIISAI